MQTVTALGPLRRVAAVIDAVNQQIGAIVSWLLLLAILISAGNAITRKFFSLSSNAWLEVQWLLFGAVFLLCAARLVSLDKHVRVDLFYRDLGTRGKAWVDLAGHLMFMVPLCIMLLIYGVPFAAKSFLIDEQSINPGGLARWPAKMLIPIGFAVLLVQAISEIIKLVARISEMRASGESGPKGHANRLIFALVVCGLLAIGTLAYVLMPDGALKAFVVHNMAPIMFVSLILGLMTGYPIAFSLAAVGLLFALIGVGLDLFQPQFLQASADRVYGTMSNETLLAIPFFTFMGLLLEKSGLAEDLLSTIGQLFGPIRGGLAFAVIFVGALLAATTGIVAASVISMGLISLPLMLRYGYSRPTATGVIVASGTLAQIIPPSLVLIVLADQLGVSVGQMYRAALAPGLIMVLLFALYILALTLIRPKALPALPKDVWPEPGSTRSLLVLVSAALVVFWLVAQFAPIERADIARVVAAAAGMGLAVLVALANRYLNLGLLSKLAEDTVLILVPPLGLIFLVLGTILIGLATPTEGGAMGALGTLILTFATGRFSFRSLREVVIASAELSTFVLFILIGARIFSLTFYGVDGHIWVEELLGGLPGGMMGFLIFVSALIFVLGFVLDFYEIAFILLPLLIAPALGHGIDLIWFGILVAVNLQTSFLTPPFGFSLFFLRSVAPSEDYKDKVTGQTIKRISTKTIYRGAIPFIALQAMLIVIVFAFPDVLDVFKRKMVELDAAAITEELNSLDFDDGLEMDFDPPSFD